MDLFPMANPPEMHQVVLQCAPGAPHGGIIHTLLFPVPTHDGSEAELLQVFRDFVFTTAGGDWISTVNRRCAVPGWLPSTTTAGTVVGITGDTTAGMTGDTTGIGVKGPGEASG